MMDWLWGLLGGLMIGTAGAGYLLVQGRIMGVTGILGDLIEGQDRSGWPFVAGLVLVPAFLGQVWSAQSHLSANIGLVALAGLLVGFGTRLANGCTSGHGVCGISRLSPRGLVATACYVLAGALVMAVLRHSLGWL